MIPPGTRPGQLHCRRFSGIPAPSPRWRIGISVFQCFSVSVFRWISKIRAKGSAPPTDPFSLHRNTETPKHRNSETPKHLNTETPQHRNSETPKLRNTETPKLLFTPPSGPATGSSNGLHPKSRFLAVVMKLCIPFLLLACGIMAAPLPTPEQLAWQKMELTMFCHFGVNTFTDSEWGDGKEDEKAFNPSELNCDQWVQAAKAGGFKLMILTAKHHDGFCLSPSAHTRHSVKLSPWKNGEGDVVREFVTACRKGDMKVGLYLSPWDRHDTSYGTDGYNDYFCKQLTELLSNYGQIDELWFDGACGEGPNGKKQEYDWDRYFALIRKLQPKALTAISGPDIRWVGNESGFARVGESSVYARGGEPVWYPAECDVSIRPGWFYHAHEDDKVKSIEHLMDIYFKSVGRNSVLLLNVPPDRRGRFAAPDVQRLKEFGETVRGLYSNVVAEGSVAGNSCLLRFNSTQPITLVNLQEDIAKGERVKVYRVDARIDEKWRTVARGTVIGQRNLLRIAEIKADAVRLVIEKTSEEPLVKISVLHATPIGPWGTTASFALTPGKPAKASDVHGKNTQYGGDKAVDGDRNTRWATSDDTRACALDVDLLDNERLGRVAISELEPRITKFRIEYRLDESQPWQVAFSGTKAGKEFEAKFPPVTARYVRLNILDATFAPTIWEFELFPADAAKL